MTCARFPRHVLILLGGLVALAGCVSEPPGHGIGYKLGFTSADARERFGVNGPVFGRLREGMRVPVGGEVAARDFSRVFVEAEIAFTIGRPIDYRIEAVEELRSHVATVHAAIELPDWRFGPDAKPDLAAIVADGVGAHRFVLGPGRDPAGLDLEAAAAVLERDGRILGRGRGGDALGSPWRALLWLARELHARGSALEAGEIVLTGALGPVHAFAPDAAAGRYRVLVEGLESVEVSVRPGSGSP